MGSESTQLTGNLIAELQFAIDWCLIADAFKSIYCEPQRVVNSAQSLNKMRQAQLVPVYLTIRRFTSELNERRKIKLAAPSKTQEQHGPGKAYFISFVNILQETIYKAMMWSPFTECVVQFTYQ